MKYFVAGIVLGIGLGLVACTAPAPLPTLAPTADPPTATVAQPTDTPPPAHTRQLTATQADATSPTPHATTTGAVTDTPEPTVTETATATPAATQTPAIAYITYQDFQIVPAQTTIRVGSTVVFLIKAGLFTFHQPYNFTAPNAFEAPSGLGDGASFTYTFQQPGAVTLLCGYHADMRATLIVEP
jgi:plastocyanin